MKRRVQDEREFCKKSQKAEIGEKVDSGAGCGIVGSKCPVSVPMGECSVFSGYYAVAGDIEIVRSIGG